MGELQDYIYEHIPVVEKNNFTIDEDREGRIAVRGRLTDHINHRASVYGGSLSNALILASWAFVRKRVLQEGLEAAVIVIQSQAVEFLKPVLADFQAAAKEPVAAEMRAMFAKIRRFSKARISIEAEITQDGDTEPRAVFRGEFVVVLPRRPLATGDLREGGR